MDRKSAAVIICLPQLLGREAAERDFQRRADRSWAVIRCAIRRQGPPFLCQAGKKKPKKFSPE